MFSECQNIGKTALHDSWILCLEAIAINYYIRKVELLKVANNLGWFPKWSCNFNKTLIVAGGKKKRSRLCFHDSKWHCFSSVRTCWKGNLQNQHKNLLLIKTTCVCFKCSIGKKLGKKCFQLWCSLVVIGLSKMFKSTTFDTSTWFITVFCIVKITKQNVNRAIYLCRIILPEWHKRHKDSWLAYDKYIWFLSLLVDWFSLFLTHWQVIVFPILLRVETIIPNRKV